MMDLRTPMVDWSIFAYTDDDARQDSRQDGAPRPSSETPTPLPLQEEEPPMVMTSFLLSRDQIDRISRSRKAQRPW
jgi:hypothetical protein